MHQNRASRPVLLYGGAGREEGDDGEKNSMLWRAGGSSGHRAGDLVYGRERGAASAGGGCTARGHRPWPDGNRYRGDVCRRRGGGGGGPGDPRPARPGDVGL